MEPALASRPTQPWRHPLAWLRAELEQLHDELLDSDPGRQRRRFDYRPVVVFVLVAVSLTLQEYYGARQDSPALLQFWPKALQGRDYSELRAFGWWAGWRVFGFLIMPMVAVFLMPGERLRDYGWSLSGLVKHLPLYLGMYLAVLPLVLWVSTRPEFQHTYPFYRLANRSTFDFWMWEVMYVAQFVSLEFFFRGFMLKPCTATMGVYAIFPMIVPYCMIHYHKPILEVLAAIFAGLILGTVALRTRSIWGGIIIHVGVAITMDLLAVRHLPPS
jgi:uncharacterized protein